MKNLILLLISITLFLLGIIFRLIPLQGAWILMVAALALFVVYSAIRYFNTRGPVIRKVLMISSAALILSVSFGIIGNRYFAEFIIVTIILGMVVFVATLFFGDTIMFRKKKDSDD